MSGLLCIVRSLHQTSEGTELNLLILSAVDFFNHLNMLYGTITEFCTPEEVRDIVSAGAYVYLTRATSYQCPIMSAGPRYAFK